MATHSIAGTVKRALDIGVAVGVLVATAPLIAVVTLLIKLEDRGPVLFRQRRVGLDGRIFTLLKFRSMQTDAEAQTGPVWARIDDPRVTRVGRWLRPLHIDEIPQVWNVLRGEMSFVGPRPERPEFVALLSASIPDYERRNTVRPGITGWAQIHLPPVSTLEHAQHRSEYDQYYLANFSLRLDLTIMARTVTVLAAHWRDRSW